MRFLRTCRQRMLVGIGSVVAGTLIAGCGVDSSAPGSASVEPQNELSAAANGPGSSAYGSVQHADESSFDGLVLQAQGPVLVDFYADWCPPCRMLAPILDDFARESPNVLVVKVDIDKAPNLATRYSIESIPSLKVFRDGEIVGEHVGLADKEELKSLVGR